MASQIKVISSMATRQVLADVVALFEAQSAERVALESVGGVDAANRVRAGEAFDAVILAANAIDQLVEAGVVVAGSRVDLVRSGVAMAVRTGERRPVIDSEDAVRSAVLAARSVSYSTGPSGAHLMKLFERWGIAAQIQDRIVQAPAGIPVGSLVADGRVELGFQQLSELMHLPGIEMLGPLPADIQIITTFSGGICTGSTQGDAVKDLLRFIASPAVEAAKQRHGMEPA